jgi:hypothetical protein
MKVFLKDGSVLHASVNHAHGYKAERIEIEPRDFDTLLNLSINRPERLPALFRALKARFGSGF